MLFLDMPGNTLTPPNSLQVGDPFVESSSSILDIYNDVNYLTIFKGGKFTQVTECYRVQETG